MLTYRHWADDLDPALCLSVDGDAPGRLHLSHWPGNRTPARFRHDLSTGMCLLLAKAKDRAQLLEGISTVTNNHWDTDGACSVFTMLNPGLALAHAQTLLSAAGVGDFGLVTTPEGLKLELTLTALTKRPDSPVASDRFDNELDRRQAQYDYMLQMMPRLLANPDLHADWFATEFWQIQQDLRALREEEVEIERFDALDFAVILADRHLHPTAINTSTGTSRILTVCSEGEGRHIYELRLTTLSWFDLATGPPRHRPDWSELVSVLNKEENAGGGTWRADDLTSPTPALAYVDGQGRPALNAARPEGVKRAIAQFFSRDPYLPAGV
jgi:hypothetical protein